MLSFPPMRRMAWMLGSLALAAACARRAAIPPPRAPPTPSPTANTGVVLLPEYGQRLVAVEPDGSSDVLLSGGARANLLDDVLRVAPQNFVADVAAAWRTHAGWVFIARDGATARSDTLRIPAHLGTQSALTWARVRSTWARSERSDEV